MRYAYKIILRKPEEKRPFGRLKDNNIVACRPAAK
jgi:hypothetical protein